MKPYNYTKKQLKFISDNRTLIRTELAAAFNKKFREKRTPIQLAALRKRNGWRTGRTGRFEKGNRPWTAGTKGMGVCKANKGSFKTGNRPENWTPVGTERVTFDGYIKVKIAEPNIWKFKHIIIWEATNGKRPCGMAVIFKDGNCLNCESENLEQVSRQVLLYLNQHDYKELPPELRASMIAVAKLECKVFALAKN
jgi:hypothetical protein